MPTPYTHRLVKIKVANAYFFVGKDRVEKSKLFLSVNLNLSKIKKKVNYFAE